MTTRHDPKTRAAELRDRIRRADDLYYNEGRPELTDAEYDDLFRELVAIEREHPELVAADSPTRRVGAPLPKGTRFPTEPHLAPMLSIESLTGEDQVREFAARVRRQLALDDDAELAWAVEPKYDGVSANLLYEDGRLTRGLSRGDGSRGEVITQNLRTIRNLPLTLVDAPPRLEVRGEVILSREGFAALQEHQETTGDVAFRNPRNTVAGTLKLLDPAIVARRRLEFICWGVGHADGLEFETYEQLWRFLQGRGFKMAEQFEVVDSIDGVIDFHRRLEAARDEIRYEMDGVVAKVNRIDWQRQLGRTARTPRWTLAYKFAPRRGVTTVEAIAAQVGRTGKVTPVAELAPLELAGVTVRRATLHNWNLLAERDVRVGDTVEVERAGDVIPAVVRVLTERRGKGSRRAQPPTHCPVCAGPLETAGAFLMCVNPECPAQLQGRIELLAGRRALDIERLGAKYVAQLIDAKLIGAVEDVFALPAREAEILALEGWGQRSFDKLAAEIEKAKNPPLDRFILALGIPQVGEQTARDLADEFGDLEALRGADEDALCEVHGVGAEVARSIRTFFALPSTTRFLEHIAAAGVTVQPHRSAGAAGPLSGRVFCFTGGLSSMSRDAAKALVESLGATTSSSLTRKVTDVVLGEKAGSKADKARKLELATMDEDAFLALVGRR